MSRIAAQILILADETAGLSTLELALLERGASVLRVRPEAAHDSIIKVRPDLVIAEPYRLDAVALHKIEASGCALVALLAEFSQDQVRRALAFGACDFIARPIQGNGALDAERLLELASGTEQLSTPRLDASVDRLRRQVQELTDRYVRQCRTNDEAQDVFYLDLSRMMTIFDNIMDGVLFADTAGQVTLMNPVAEELLGVRTIFAIGKRLEAIGLHEAVQKELQRAHDDVMLDSCNRETVLEIEDGDCERFIKLRTTVVLDYRGSCAGVLTILKDVTDVVVGEQLRNRYLSIVSHELRTPLTGIKSFSSMMAQGVLGDLNERQQRVADAIREQTQRLEYEVDKLISLGRIESGDFALDREFVEVRDLLSKVTLPFVSIARDRSIEFEVSDVPTGVIVEADRADFRRAVRALVENAIKFTPDGGEVKIFCRLEPDFVSIEVEDNGPGIHAKHQRRIFDKFFQVEDPLTRVHGGAGLGLHVAQAVAKAHAGSLDLESALGQGAKFRIRMPRSAQGGSRDDLGSTGAPEIGKNGGQAESEFGRKEQGWNGQS